MSDDITPLAAYRLISKACRKVRGPDIDQAFGVLFTAAEQAEDGQPLYAVTREMVEELAKREVTDEEVSRIRSSIEFSTVREAVEDAVFQVIDVPGDEDE
jgi:ABC-type taurine transport system ATPase subunit